jgi:hypothetical protein
LLGSLSFEALPGKPAFVPLDVANVIGLKTDGTPVGNNSGISGRIVVIGLQPLLGASLDTNAARILTIYGNPGSNYSWVSITNLQFTNRQLQGSILMTNLWQNTNVNQTAPKIFYRAH